MRFIYSIIVNKDAFIYIYQDSYLVIVVLVSKLSNVFTYAHIIPTVFGIKNVKQRKRKKKSYELQF